MCIAILSSVRLDAIHFAFLFGTHPAPPGDPVVPCLRKEEAAKEEWKAGRIAAPGNGDPELKVQYNPTCDGEGNTPELSET